jgi:transposase
MARAAAISPASVQRLWAASDIKPHLSRTFKLSNDQRFEEKFWDVTGLYLNPPNKALVLCCDEKSQCQALERTQPGLPLGIGHIRTKTHDYVRHGTLTLFAALNYLEGKLITRLARPRPSPGQACHQEWLAFLKTIDQETPADLDIHIIADNYATHKHPAVSRWLDRHARFHMHYTPTSSSWMNLVERFFREPDRVHQREELCLDPRTRRRDHRVPGGTQIFSCSDALLLQFFAGRRNYVNLIGHAPIH